jgi:hypothetical protein
MIIEQPLAAIEFHLKTENKKVVERQRKKKIKAGIRKTFCENLTIILILIKF